jgi:hypothetical protein
VTKKIREKEKEKEKKRNSNEGVGGVVYKFYIAWLYASQASCASRRTGVSLANVLHHQNTKLTLQNLSLRHICLASTLKGSAINEIQNDTVGQLLSVLVWWIWRAEVAQVEALHNTLLIVLGRAEDEISHGVDLDPSSFPQLS